MPLNPAQQAQLEASEAAIRRQPVPWAGSLGEKLVRSLYHTPQIWANDIRDTLNTLSPVMFGLPQLSRPTAPPPTDPTESTIQSVIGFANPAYAPLGILKGVGRVASKAVPAARALSEPRMVSPVQTLAAQMAQEHLDALNRLQAPRAPSVPTALTDEPLWSKPLPDTEAASRQAVDAEAQARAALDAFEKATSGGQWGSGNFQGGGLVRPIMRLFRGIDIPHPEISAGLRRPTPYPFLDNPSAVNVNLRPGAFWTSENPAVARSYAAQRGSYTVPLDLMQPPDVTLSAQGQPWRDYFKAHVGQRQRGQFYDALRDPAVRSIMVKDVVDPGLGSLIRPEGEIGADESTLDYLRRVYGATNVLVKDPSVVQYVSGEPVEPWKPIGGPVDVGYQGGGKVKFPAPEDMVKTLRPEIRFMRLMRGITPTAKATKPAYAFMADPTQTFKGGGRVPMQLGGLVRGALSRLVKYGEEIPAKLSALQITKDPGGNWLSGSVEEALRPLKGGLVPQLTYPPEVLQDPRLQTELAQRNSTLHLNDWIDKKLTRYVKNEMATPNDPIRALAEKGVLHVPPETLNFNPNFNPMRLDSLGLSSSMVGQNLPAKMWEGASDIKVNPTIAKHLSEEELAKTFGGKSNIDPETPIMSIYEPQHLPNDLGFDHLIDELSNATSPTSDLPMNLRIKPESLSQVSVPQAVQRVSDINKWREAQMLKAQQEAATGPAVHPVREYPEGMKWVELKQPEGATDVSALQNALKYEGNAMGHCVGGYCPEVSSGSSRIFSLRDADGGPHVTIEVSPKESIEGLPELPPLITQIKGKGNRAPIPTYLPYVQDFVKNSPLGQDWGAVGDARNAGLVPANSLFTPDELSSLGSQIPQHGWLTPDQVQSLTGSPPPDSRRRGGHVKLPKAREALQALGAI